jgi:hypothetical protein
MKPAVFDANLISPRIAHERLSRLIATGTYLPSEECQKRLTTLRRKFKIK